MQMPNSYTYRFFYKIGFYLLLLVCVAQSVAWIGTSISRDNSRAKELFWRGEYVYSRALLNFNARVNDIKIDIATAQDVKVCEIYCEQLRQFKLNHAKRHNHEN